MSKEFTDIHALIGAVAKDYQYKETFSVPQWIASLWEKGWQFFWQKLSTLLSKIGGLFLQLGQSLKGAGISGKWLIVIFLATLFCALLAFIIWQQRHRQKNNWLNKDNIAERKILNGPPSTSLEWQQQAFLYKEQGRFDEACRALHRACLQRLDEAGLIIFASARSNYEYVLALSRLPVSVNMQSRQQLREIFQKFSNTVDAVYFGNRRADEAEFQFCLQSLQQIESYLATNAGASAEK